MRITSSFNENRLGVPNNSGQKSNHYVSKKALPGPEVMKLFVLNSAEHDVFSANKYENANNSWHFHIY